MDGPRAQEIAVEDISEVVRICTALDHLFRTSTLAVRARDPRRPPMVLRHVRRADSLAALLEILASGTAGPVDRALVRAALAWRPRSPLAEYTQVFASVGAM